MVLKRQRLGAITKVGVPAIRRIITEMVWRMILFQPQYRPVQKWQEVLQGTNRTLKKKAVVAIGRQLMVDLWIRTPPTRVPDQIKKCVAFIGCKPIEGSSELFIGTVLFSRGTIQLAGA